MRDWVSRSTPLATTARSVCPVGAGAFVSRIGIIQNGECNDRCNDGVGTFRRNAWPVPVLLPDAGGDRVVLPAVCDLRHEAETGYADCRDQEDQDRKSTRLNSSH